MGRPCLWASDARLVLLFGTAAALQLTAASPALASGFYLQEQSVRGWGRANSGEVADSGPASLWWNPAAIAGADRRSSAFGLTAIFPNGQIRDEGTTIDRPGAAPAPVGGPSVIHDPVQTGAFPTNSGVLPLTDRIALGLAVSSPFSFTTDYHPQGWQRYTALRTRLMTIDVQPSIAIKAAEWLNVGAGINIVYSDAYLSNALPNVTPGASDGFFMIKGKGFQFGWSAGLQVRPAKRVSLGVAYKSKVDHRQEGSTAVRGLAGPLAGRNLESDVVVRFTTPGQLIMGARVGIDDRTTLNVQAVRFEWSKFDRIAIGAPHDTLIRQEYKDVWSFALGADHELSDRLTLRTGVQFDQTPTRDLGRDPRVPDADRINYAAGGTFRLTDHLLLDAAVSYTDFEDTAITRDALFYAGTPAETAVAGNGRGVGQRAIVVALGGRMEF